MSEPSARQEETLREDEQPHHQDETHKDSRETSERNDTNNESVEREQEVVVAEGEANGDPGIIDFSLLYRQYCAEIPCRVNSAVLRLLDAAPHQSLVRLPLGNNYIGAKGFAAVLRLIEKCPTIEEIDLSGNGLDNNSVADLVRILKDHKGISKLNLSNNAMSLDGGKLLMKLVEDNTRIIELKVDGTDIFESLAERLAMAVGDNYQKTTGKVPFARPSRPMSSRPLHIVSQVASPHIVNVSGQATPARPHTASVGSGPRTTGNFVATPMSGTATDEKSPSISTVKPRPPNPALASNQAARLSETQREELRERYRRRADTYKHVQVSTAKQAAQNVRRELELLEAADRLAEERKRKEQQTTLSPQRVQGTSASGSPTKAQAADAKSTGGESAPRPPPRPPARSNTDSTTASSSPSKASQPPPEFHGVPVKRRTTGTFIVDGLSQPQSSSETNAQEVTVAQDDAQSEQPRSRPEPAEVAKPSPSEQEQNEVPTQPNTVMADFAGLRTRHELNESSALGDTRTEPSSERSDNNGASAILTLPLSATAPHPSKLVLTVQQQFQALFDLGCRNYSQRNLDAAYIAWNEAMAVATEQRNREWMAIMNQNLQRLTYELVMTEGAKHLAEGKLEEADRKFEAAGEVASRARNAGWEAEVQRARRSVVHAQVQSAHDRATALFEKACNAPDVVVTPDDRYQLNGQLVQHSAAFVSEWQRMLFLKEAMELWTGGWITTKKRMQGSTAKVLQDVIQSSVVNVCQYFLRYGLHINSLRCFAEGSLPHLEVYRYSGYETRQLLRLWVDLQAYCKQVECVQWEAIANLVLGHLELGVYQLGNALSRFEVSLAAATEIQDDALVAFAHIGRGLVAQQRSHFSEAEQCFHVAQKVLSQICADLIPSTLAPTVALLSRRPASASLWLHPTVAKALHTFTQERLTEVVVGAGRHREALELLEQSRLYAEVDLLKEKLLANFAAKPTADHISAVSSTLRCPLVYYHVLHRFDWSVDDDQYLVADYLFTWVVPPAVEGDLRFVVTDVSNGFKVPSLKKLVEETRRALYISDEVGGSAGDQQRANDMILAIPTVPWRQPLKTLYSILLDPIIAFLRAQTGYLDLGSVCIFPSSTLWLVPWAALIDQEEQYFVQHFAPSFGFSATQVAFSVLTSQRVRRGRKGAKAISLPEAEATTSSVRTMFPLDALRGVAEANRVAEVLKGEVASLEHDVLKLALPKARMLHVAASIGSGGGVGTKQNESICGICCETAFDHVGLLHSAEIAGMDLQLELTFLTNANLVGGAHRQTSADYDPALSVTRALLSGGSSTVITAQWCTPDMMPIDLAVPFYSAYAKEPDRAKALARAMQARIRRSAPVVTNHRSASPEAKDPSDSAHGESPSPLSLDISPRLWAGYIVIGSPLPS
jgi:hypothetical protein